MPNFTTVVFASNRTAAPAAAGLNVRAATGAWSGATATPRAAPLSATALPAVFVAVAIGTTLLAAAT